MKKKIVIIKNGILLLSLGFVMIGCDKPQTAIVPATEKTGTTEKTEKSPLSETDRDSQKTIVTKPADEKKPQPLPEKQAFDTTVNGTLKHFPADVKSAKAWFGHNFMVDGTPILPTETVTKEMLKKHVGKNVIVSGTWYEGKVWIPSEEEKKLPLPVDLDQGDVIRGDGLRALFLLLE